MNPERTSYLKVYIDESCEHHQRELLLRQISSPHIMASVDHVLGELIQPVIVVYHDSLRLNFKPKNEWVFFCKILSSNMSLFAQDDEITPYVVINDDSELSVFADFYEKLNATVIQKQMQSLAKKIISNTQKWFQFQNSFTKALVSDRIFDLLEDRDAQFYLDLDVLTKDYEALCKKKKWPQVFKLLTSAEVLSLNSLQQTNVLYLGKLVNEQVYLLKINKEETSLNPDSLDLLSFFYLEWKLSGQKKILHQSEDAQLIEECFQSYPFPIALIDSLGNVVNSNHMYAKLNVSMSELLLPENKKKYILINDKRYLVLTLNENIPYDFKVLLFIQQDSIDLKESSHLDLGVITSSIAHELMNPFAGVLAGIELLLLDVAEPEIVKDLKSMQTSALRSKALVNLLLRFSKKAKDQTPQLENISLLIDQALDLMRIRFAENQLRVEKSYHQIHHFSYPVLKSNMVMCFYLLLSDVLTQAYHLNLLRPHTNQNQTFKIFCEEHSDQIILKALDLSGKKISLKSQLVLYLCEEHGIKIVESVDGFILKHAINSH
jgi:hypothetical protein